MLVWFATLVALAEGLNRVGFVGWAAKAFAATLVGIPPVTVLAILVAFFFLRALHVREPDRPRRGGAAGRARDGMAVPGCPFGRSRCCSSTRSA